MATKAKPDIRALTRLVPPSGNLVQGQSELTINPRLARAAAEVIGASRNHYCPAEGTAELRDAVAKKIAAFNGVQPDPQAKPLELLITPGGTGGLISIAQTYLRDTTTIVFEPYYPYHRRILEEMGGRTEAFRLKGPTLELDIDALRRRCLALKDQESFPLRAIIVCSPANPSGKVLSQAELEGIATICQDLDLLCISDEVYEHYVTGERSHISIASLPGMWERTITVNSFSKSWNISGWRLGYAYGSGELVGPINNANNVFYVCAPSALQLALAEVLMTEPQYYTNLNERFSAKRKVATESLQELGFEIFDSGSAFYIWARIPTGFTDAMEFNSMLMSRGGVGAVPGSAFADSDDWDNYMRICIAREDNILAGALAKIHQAMRG